MASPCRVLPFDSYAESLPRLLAALGAPPVLARQRRILIKPNLVNLSPPPVTVPVAMVTALVEAIRSCSEAEIVIAEGCGDLHLETPEVFRRHGYDRLAERFGVSLVDLNVAGLVRKEQPGCRVFPFMMLPKILFEAFVISVPVLKAHSLAGVTLSMKNLIGCAPPEHYQQGGHWKKSAFHRQMHQSILELNRYRKPDLALVDASVGLAEHHLGGPTCDPPVGRLLGGFDPVAVDAAGAALLGRDWRDIPHIRHADGLLGSAEPLP